MELIVAHVTGNSRLDVLIRPEMKLNSQQEEELNRLLLRRAAGEPVAYLLGWKEFYSRPFRVDSRAMIPRPETELVIDHSKRLMKTDNKLIAGDICSGSGNLAVTFCCEFCRAQCVATDVSRSALELARENAVFHSVQNRILFTRQNWAEAIEHQSLDLAVCNPPYIASSMMDKLSREVADFEPWSALEGGLGGHEKPVAVVQSIARVLKPGGYLLLEIGWDQAEKMKQEMREFGKLWQDIRVLLDFQGHPRILSAKKCVT